MSLGATPAMAGEPLSIPPRLLDPTVERVPQPTVEQRIKQETDKLRVEYEARIRLLEERLLALENNMPPDMMKMIDEVKHSSVHVELKGGCGSGTIVETPLGPAILTSHHVISELLDRDRVTGKVTAQKGGITIAFFDGSDLKENAKEKDVPAQILCVKAGKIDASGDPVVDREADIAFLYIAPDKIPKHVKPVKMLTADGVQKHLKAGAECFSITHAGSQNVPSVTVNPGAGSLRFNVADGDRDLVQRGKLRHIEKFSVDSPLINGPVCIEDDMMALPGRSGSGICIAVKTEKGWEPRLVGLRNWRVPAKDQNVSTRIDDGQARVNHLVRFMPDDEMKRFKTNVDEPRMEVRRKILKEVSDAMHGVGGFIESKTPPDPKKREAPPLPKLPMPREVEPKKSGPMTKPPMPRELLPMPMPPKMEPMVPKK